MANTKVPQSLQIRPTLPANYLDTRTPSLANYETNATDLEYDLNSLRSVVNNFLNRDGSSFPTGDWYNDIIAPVVFSSDAGASTTIRGINTLGDDLWGIQRKRILKRISMINVDVPDPVNAQVVILALADIPSTTTAAVGAVTTLGTVVAEATTFGTAGLDEVAGANALQPKNLMILTDIATGEAVIGVISGKQIYGLLQSEFSADGTTITGTTPDRVQISFVKHDATNDDLELATAGDMNGIVFNYAYVKRDAFEDCPEEAWLGDGFADFGVANATRQAVYDNNPNVETVASATLKLGTGFLWNITDQADDVLFRTTESSAGGAPGSSITIGTSGATESQSLAVNPETVEFTHGIAVDFGSDPIHIGNATSGADTILFTGPATVNGGTSTLSLQTTSNNINITTVTGGAIDVQAVGNVTLDSSAGSLGIGTDANTGAINVGTAASARTITVGNATGATALDFNSGTGGTLIDSTGVISLDAVGVSNFTTVSGNLTVSTVTSGGLIVSAADAVAISAGDEAAAAGNNISLTAGSATAGTGAGGAIVSAAGAGFATGTGGTNSVTAGTGGATGDGGAISVNAGDGGATSGFGGDLTLASGAGGLVGGGGITFLTSGNGGATSGDGGGMNVNAGDAVGLGLGGTLNMSAGNSAGAFGGQDATVNAGSAGTTGVGGYVNLNAGGGGSTSGDGGFVVISSGDGLGAGVGGEIQLLAAEGTTDNGFTNFTGSFDMADTDEFWRLSPSGAATNGPNSGGSVFVSMFAGNRDPDTIISATPGSLYMRGNSTTSAVYLNDTLGTAAGTDWVRIATLDDIAASNDLSEVVNNQLTAGVFTQNAGQLEWGVPDGGSVRFGDSSNVDILSVAAAALGDSVVVTMAETAAGATFAVTDGTNNLLRVIGSTGGDSVVIENIATFSANATGAVTVDGASFSIDATTASNASVTGANLSLQTLTSGTLVVNSAGALDMDGASNVSIDSPGGISIDAGSSSNFTAAGTLQLQAITAGDVDIDSVGNLLADADVMEFNPNVQNTGHILDRSDFHYFGDTNRGNNYGTFNAQYVSSTATTGGTVVVRSAATVVNGTITASTAAVVSTTDAILTTSGITGLAAGTLIIVEGAFPKSLNGLYEVQSGASTSLSLRGVGLNPLGTGNTFTKGDVDTNGSATGTIYIATVCVMRCSTTGVWEVGDFSATPAIYTTLSTSGGVSLDTAYVAGNTIDVRDAEGSVTLFSTSTTNTTTDLLTINNSPTVANTGDAVSITTGANVSGAAVNVTNAGTGDALFVNNTSTGDAIDIQDGGTSVLQVTGGGAVNIIPTSATNATITTASTGVVDINSGAAVTIDAAGPSNFTVAGSTLAFATTGSGDISVTGAAAVNTTLNAASTTAIATDAVTLSFTDATNNLFQIERDDTGGDEVRITSSVDLFSSDSTVFSIQGSGDSDVQTVSTTVGTVTTTFNTTTSGIAGTAVTDVTAQATGTGVTTANLNVYAATTAAGGTATLNLNSNVANGGESVVNLSNVGPAGSTVSISDISGTGDSTVTIGNVTSTGANVIELGNSTTSSSTTVEIANLGNTNTVEIASGGSGPGTVLIGNVGGSHTNTIRSGTAVSTQTADGWIVTFPAKTIIAGAALNKALSTNTSVYEVDSSKMFYANGAAGGNLFTVTGVGDEGRTATTGTTAGDVWLKNLVAATVTAPVSFVAGVAATSDAVINVTLGGGAALAAGMILVVQGTNLEINNGPYEIVSVSTDAVTVAGMLTAVTAGFEFVNTQVTADTTVTGVIAQGVFSGVRMAADGTVQIIENASTNATTWTGITTAGVTLSSAYATPGTTPITQGASFRSNITDTETRQWGTVTGNHNLLNLAAVSGADAVTLLDNEAGSTFTSNAAINVVTTGLSVDGGTAANEITIGATSAGGTANAIETPAGSLTVGSTNTAPGGSATTVRTPDTGGAGVTGNISVFAGINANSGTSGGTILAHGSDFSAGADAVGGSGAATFRAGDDTAGNLTTGAAATFRAGIAAVTGGTANFQGGAAFVGSGGTGGLAAVAGGAGDGIGDGGANTSRGGDSGTGAGDGGAGTYGGGDALGSGTGGATLVTTGTSATGNSGALTLRTEDAGTGGTADLISILGGDGNGSGDGSGLTITLGASGATAGNGGDLVATAGAGTGGTATGGGVSFATGANGGSGAAGIMQFSTANNANGDVGLMQFTGGNATGSGAGGIISLIPGSSVSGAQGYVGITSTLASTQEVLKLDNSAGTDGTVVDLFVSDIVPTFSAVAGAVAFFNDGATANTGGRMFIQVDGATGTDWRQVMTTTGTTTPRQFAQVVVNTTITGSATEAASTNLTQAKCSTGTMPTRVSGHDFDTQSMIYFNGVVMMNATGNDVKVATIGTTAVDIHLLAGVQLLSGDIVTIEYMNF